MGVGRMCKYCTSKQEEPQELTKMLSLNFAEALSFLQKLRISNLQWDNK
jgi:hypothetical protein